MAINFPGSLDTNASLYTAVNNLAAILNNGGTLSSGATTITVASTTGFPAVGFVTIDSEAISYTGTTGTTFTGCTRGADGTTAATHTDGSQVKHCVIAAHHNQLKDALIATETVLSNTPTNLAINGGMDYWSNGTSFGSAPASDTTTADFWNIEYNNSITNVTVSQEATIIDTGTYSAKLLCLDPNTATTLYFQQIIPNFAQYAGYTVTLTVRARTNAGTFKAQIADNIGSSTSSALTANGTFQTLTVSRTLSAGITVLVLRIGYVDTTPVIGTSYLGPVMMTLGATSVPYTPRSVIALSSQVKATTTNDSAKVGYVGQYVESVVASTSAGTSSTYTDFTSINLAAGDWDVTLVGHYDNNGATSPGSRVGISVTSGNSSTGLVVGSNAADFGVNNSALGTVGAAIPSYRMSLSTATTVYYKWFASYATATPKLAGRISARRVR